MTGKTGGSGAFELWIEHKRELDRWGARLARRVVAWQLPPDAERPPAPAWPKSPNVRREHREQLAEFDARMKKPPSCLGGL